MSETHRPPPTPFCGFARDDNGRRIVPESATNVLVSGPSGIGKTSTVLAPAAVLWTAGPVVIVGPKDDLMELVMQRRYGPSALIDLRPDYEADYPGVEQLSFDPTKLIGTPDQAFTIANTMMAMSAVGMGSGADQVSDAGIWESNSETPLAAMLYAASPPGRNQRGGNGGGIDWILHAVNNTKVTPKNQQIPTDPGWEAAAEIVKRLPLFSEALKATLEMDPKQRDSIALTVRKAVMPWMRLSMRGVHYPAFDETFLADPTATLYVLTPAEGSIAGAAVTLLDFLIRLWRAKTSRKEMSHRLLIVVDEAANVAPMPALRRYISEGRGLGVNLMLAVQASSQLETVYGSAYMRELRDTFPGALVMFGAPEMEFLQRAEEWEGQTTRRQETFDQVSSQKTVSSHLGSTLDYRRLLPQNRSHARLVRLGTAGELTELEKWEAFVEIYDKAIQRILKQPTTPQVRQSMWGRLAERHRQFKAASNIAAGAR
ncbi:type IV secretory system conjugative DNA transfer family protein [Mycobacterium sp. 48b]|uniref:type IV secretory system conjugative DNA transfer family protein n=1 Tax=Mycobacterium sp. 48b TaxID=3400426 RepID=UPI003AB035D4